MNGLLKEYSSAPNYQKNAVRGAILGIVGLAGLVATPGNFPDYFPPEVVEYRIAQQELNVKQFSLKEVTAFQKLNEKRAMLEQRVEALSTMPQVKEYISSPFVYSFKTPPGYVALGSLALLLSALGFLVASSYRFKPTRWDVKSNKLS